MTRLYDSTLTGFDGFAIEEPFNNQGLISNRNQRSFKMSDFTFFQVAKILELKSNSILNWLVQGYIR